jgi:hypothetical protein
VSLWEGTARYEPGRIQSPEDKAPLYMCVLAHVCVYMRVVYVCVCVCVCDIKTTDIENLLKQKKRNLKLPKRENRERL